MGTQIDGQSSATTLSSYSYTLGVSLLSLVCMLQFGNKEQQRLLRSQWTTADIHAYMEYIIRVIRAKAYDKTVMETSMDEESIMCLTTLFTTTTVAIRSGLGST